MATLAYDDLCRMKETNGNASIHKGDFKMTYMMHDGYGGWMFGGMWIFTLLFWVLVIAGVVLLVNWLRRQNTNESALEILKKRYVRGEIDKETYERLKKEIEV